MEYLSLPLVMRDGYLARSDLDDSIRHSVGLIISTRIGSIGFSPDFGCDLWDKEYADLYAANKADVRASLRNAIDSFEKRLYNVTVSFGLATESAPHILGITVKVSGNFKDGKEELKFEASYGLG
ncbi:MAG: GPW/gp25 family protein [candidate division Zixibacteria bacterium]|nr:GPW/gp25 family protein [candidate division Zixibacteria bacterium]MDH3939165.1 GPW/gp25 family protein [candidate division Zixibacteria bacterium]MDH4034187.1 GPW/gp25 family protein [candidate division Zixibacteria bacterium]